jgi:hypothetical protein
MEVPSASSTKAFKLIYLADPKRSVTTTPVFVAVNCITFDTLSCLTGPNADLFFVTNRCFICHHALHRSESCPQHSLGTLFCKRLDDPHCASFSCILVLVCWLIIVCRVGCSLPWLGCCSSNNKRWVTAPMRSDAGWDIPEDDPYSQTWLV